MKTVEVSKHNVQLFSNYDFADISDEDWTTLVNVALERLKSLLCDQSLTADALPVALLPLMADLLTWSQVDNPADYGIQSETKENYSYSRMSGEQTANLLVRLRDKYGDVIETFSKCDAKDGLVENARHNPLWTPDFYLEEGGEQ